MTSEQVLNEMSNQLSTMAKTLDSLSMSDLLQLVGMLEDVKICALRQTYKLRGFDHLGDSNEIHS